MILKLYLFIINFSVLYFIIPLLYNKVFITIFKVIGYICKLLFYLYIITLTNHSLISVIFLFKNNNQKAVRHEVSIFS